MLQLGKSHVLGFAVGNEMDIFYEKTKDTKCVTELWNTRYWEQMQAYVHKIDSKGFADTPITIVWAMSVLNAAPGDAWLDAPNAKVNTLVTQAHNKWGNRFVWSFNVYGIWDRNLYPTSPADCKEKSHAAVNIKYTQGMLKSAREAIKKTTGTDESIMWVGENGWSSPNAVGHPSWDFCPDYSSTANFQRAYQSFMSWDLTAADGFKGVDHAFYFTMRDAFNGAAQEHFGLIKGCDDSTCKVDGSAEVNVSRVPEVTQMV
jgi:hypothetical protein